MKKELLYGVGGLLIGGAIAGLVAITVNNNTEKAADTGMSMSDMAASLKGKTGDDFDKAFLSSMIEHHQGAIEMANLAKTNAKHDEIKNMANDIISAQSNEIDTMQSWQTDWSYKTVPTSHDSMSH